MGDENNIQIQKFNPGEPALSIYNCSIPILVLLFYYQNTVPEASSATYMR